MTYLVTDQVKQPLSTFRSFEADAQLALLWFLYLDIKEHLTPAPPHSVEEVGSAIFDQIKALSPEEQLQAQRDIANGADTTISRGYQVLSSPAKLDVWLLLAQGIENGTIIAVPSDYTLPQSAQMWLENVRKELDFEQYINLIRNAVDGMGSAADNN